MAADLTLSQGDTYPALVETITDSNGNPVDLTGATVTFVMRQLSSAAPTVNAAATITNETAGQVSYSWSTTDTEVTGLYMAQFVVTLSNGTDTFRWPQEGYLEVEVQESLVGASQQLITVAAAKDVLNIGPTDRSQDDKILRFINSWRPLIETVTGPIIQQTFEEWYSGGTTSIVLRRRPSTALGTSPVLFLNAVSEYVGPIEWPLSIISSPDQGQLYSCQLNSQIGEVVRRTVGGGVQPFPAGPQAVHVWYTAGQQIVPDNVSQAMAVLLQLHYQKTQQGGPASWRGDEDEGAQKSAPIGFGLPGVVREMLLPNRRAPSIA